MTEVPFFLPTAAGPMAAVASLPDAGPLRGPAVVMLPEGGMPRIHQDALAGAARALATCGQPVLRIDYPGLGASPGVEVERGALAEATREASQWFLREVGVDGLALAGLCLGADFAIAVAAAEPDVGVVVLDQMRLRPRRKRTGGRLRDGVAALEGLAQVPHLGTTGTNKRYDDDRWKEPLLEGLEACAAHVFLLATPGSPAAREHAELLASEVLTPRAAARLQLVVRAGDEVAGPGHTGRTELQTHLVRLLGDATVR